MILPGARIANQAIATQLLSILYSNDAFLEVADTENIARRRFELSYNTIQIFNMPYIASESEARVSCFDQLQQFRQQHMPLVFLHL